MGTERKARRRGARKTRHGDDFENGYGSIRSRVGGLRRGGGRIRKNRSCSGAAQHPLLLSAGIIGVRRNVVNYKEHPVAVSCHHFERAQRGAPAAKSRGIGKNALVNRFLGTD